MRRAASVIRLGRLAFDGVEDWSFRSAASMQVIQGGAHDARLLSNSAIRVCQPGPVAFQAARTDSGRRMVT